jgi:hypothetical protein
MTQQHAQEFRHLNGVDVVLPKLNVQSHPGAFGRNRKRRNVLPGTQTPPLVGI